MAKTHTAPKMSTAIAIVAAPAGLAALSNVLSKYVVADKKFMSVAEMRDKMVLEFRDECEALGWKNLSAIKPKGAHHDEFSQMMAKAYLTSAALAAWTSTIGKVRPRGSAAVLANNIVRNRSTTLIKAVEALWDAKGLPAKGKGKGEGKGEGKARAKALNVFIAEQVDVILKRIGDDARKENASWDSHAELKAIFDTAKKAATPLLAPKH